MGARAPIFTIYFNFALHTLFPSRLSARGAFPTLGLELFSVEAIYKLPPSLKDGVFVVFIWFMDVFFHSWRNCETQSCGYRHGGD